MATDDNLAAYFLAQTLQNLLSYCELPHDELLAHDWRDATIRDINSQTRRLEAAGEESLARRVREIAVKLANVLTNNAELSTVPVNQWPVETWRGWYDELATLAGTVQRIADHADEAITRRLKDDNEGGTVLADDADGEPVQPLNPREHLPEYTKRLRTVAQYLRAYGLGSEVRAKVSAVLACKPGETSVLVTIDNDRTAANEQRIAAQAELLTALGKLRRGYAPANFNAAATADLIEQLADTLNPAAGGPVETSQPLDAAQGNDEVEAPNPPSTPCLENGQLYIDGEPFRLTDPENNVLEAFADQDGAMEKDELESKSGQPDAVAILKRLDGKYPLLKIRFPGGKSKGGYWVKVKRCDSAPQ